MVEKIVDFHDRERLSARSFWGCFRALIPELQSFLLSRLKSQDNAFRVYHCIHVTQNVCETKPVIYTRPTLISNFETKVKMSLMFEDRNLQFSLVGDDISFVKE